MTSYLGYRDGSGFTNEQGFKEELSKLFTKGVSYVHAPTSLAVNQRGAGANMSVDVAIGDAHLVLPSALYSYWGWTDAVAKVSISAASPSNPRLDALVAYVDLSVTTGTNNPGAFKFAAVAGTPAGSPSAPTDSTIQAALGSSVPFIRLANVAVAASASTIVNANITDLRQPIAVKAKLWGGSSNTTGHTVPNIADAYLALTSNSSGLVNFAALLSTIFSDNVATFTNTGAGGGVFFYINLGGIKLLWGSFNGIATGSPGTLTLPTSFFNTIQTVLSIAGPVVGTAAVETYINSLSTSAISIGLNATTGAGTMPVQVLAIGT